MNVFVLSTGRCGTETFTSACHHISNYSVAHESNRPKLNTDKTFVRHSLDYADNHIEVDNRLSWFLGTLDKKYGKNAYYVHLIRKQDEVAASSANRGVSSVLFSFTSGILQYHESARNFNEQQRYEAGLLYWDTVNDNIEMFLRDKPNKKVVWLHDVHDSFKQFWRDIGAQGDLDAALLEWNMHHNISRSRNKSGWSLKDDHWSYQLALTHHELTGLIPEQETFILIDDDKIGINTFSSDYRCIPFVEEDGKYWGAPSDDRMAISEIERLREKGAIYLVFAWPAFWWFSHYHVFSNYLLSRYKKLLETDRVVVFKLD